jgi:hypothetical protein
VANLNYLEAVDHKTCRSEAHLVPKDKTNHETSSTRPESSEFKGHIKGPCERQRPFGGTEKGGQVKMPKQDGQPIYAMVAGWAFGWEICLRSIRGSDL